MTGTKIEELAGLGQSIWLDSISRSMIENGNLQALINKGLRGMTSNPTIFEQAISSGSDYDKKIKELNGQGKSTFEIYDELTIRDVQDAADLFRPVYEKTGGLDGYVSLEINPKLAFDTDETIKEGKRLHGKVNRPNVMFKVPSTEEGFNAIEELLAEGINVNITLIFSLAQYVKTANAFLKGMKRLHEKQGDVSKVSSVASVFVSRIDTAADSLIDEKLSVEQDAGIKDKLRSLRGKTAVANSRLIFQKYLEIFSGNEFQLLKDKGAGVQRVLWGSTGTKDPDYSDIKYVTELIGNSTVNTLPQKTVDLFLDHGIVKESLTGDLKQAEEVINALKGFGIDVNTVCAKLLDKGVTAFERSFDSLLNTIEIRKNG
ncbi:MAG: transaldolase [Thermodesulfovibrionia bacterium]|nr:MAG: transaldolase [Thermodesulfovibrionia bacterium]